MVLVGIVAILVLRAPAIVLAARAADYRETGNADSLWVVLKTLRNGDRVEKVEQLLGNGPRNHDPKYRQVCAMVLAADPVNAPAGFQESDELVGYRGGGMSIFLQFRDGKLVNHNPNDYPMEFNALQ